MDVERRFEAVENRYKALNRKLRGIAYMLAETAGMNEDANREMRVDIDPILKHILELKVNVHDYMKETEVLATKVEIALNDVYMKYRL